MTLIFSDVYVIDIKLPAGHFLAFVKSFRNPRGRRKRLNLVLFPVIALFNFSTWWHDVSEITENRKAMNMANRLRSYKVADGRKLHIGCVDFFHLSSDGKWIEQVSVFCGQWTEGTWWILTSEAEPGDV